MSLSPSERRVLLDRLRLEHDMAPGAALASDVADQFDVTMATLLTCGDPALVADALTLVHDATPVVAAQPPHEPQEGGYGRHFGALTVGDKAQFYLRRVLGAERADAAIAQGPTWVQGQALRWDAAARRFR